MTDETKRPHRKKHFYKVTWGRSEALLKQLPQLKESQQDFCMIGYREPTKTEAQEFIGDAMYDRLYDTVISVQEISKEEALLHFNMDNWKNQKVFGTDMKSAGKKKVDVLDNLSDELPYLDVCYSRFLCTFFGMKPDFDIAQTKEFFNQFRFSSREEMQKRIDSFINNSLSELDAQILSEHYGLNETRTPKTLKEIGQEKGISVDTVQKINAKALRHLRHPDQNRNLFIPLSEEQIKSFEKSSTISLSQKIQSAKNRASEKNIKKSDVKEKTTEIFL